MGRRATDLGQLERPRDLPITRGGNHAARHYRGEWREHGEDAFQSASAMRTTLIANGAPNIARPVSLGFLSYFNLNKRMEKEVRAQAERQILTAAPLHVVSNLRGVSCDDVLDGSGQDVTVVGLRGHVSEGQT